MIEFHISHRVAGAVLAAVVGTVIGLGIGQCAKAETLRIELAPPTVLGIEDHSPAYSPYPGPVRRFAPSAGIVRLIEPTGATPCGGAFEVVSGPKARRGCLR